MAVAICCLEASIRSKWYYGPIESHGSRICESDDNAMLLVASSITIYILPLSRSEVLLVYYKMHDISHQYERRDKRVQMCQKMMNHEKIRGDKVDTVTRKDRKSRSLPP